MGWIKSYWNRHQPTQTPSSLQMDLLYIIHLNLEIIQYLLRFLSTVSILSQVSINCHSTSNQLFWNSNQIRPSSCHHLSVILRRSFCIRSVILSGSSELAWKLSSVLLRQLRTNQDGFEIVKRFFWIFLGFFERSGRS